MSSGFIPPHGGYQDLLSCRKSLIVYDTTVQFCKRFLDRRDRTVDHLVQAARSGKQNIIEGSMASGTSKEMEIKLMNVARASLEELLEDDRDFLRTNDGLLWDKNSEQALFVRNLGLAMLWPTLSSADSSGQLSAGSTDPTVGTSLFEERRPS